MLHYKFIVRDSVYNTSFCTSELFTFDSFQLGFRACSMQNVLFHNKHESYSVHTDPCGDLRGKIPLHYKSIPWTKDSYNTTAEGKH